MSINDAYIKREYMRIFWTNSANLCTVHKTKDTERKSYLMEFFTVLFKLHEVNSAIRIAEFAHNPLNSIVVVLSIHYVNFSVALQLCPRLHTSCEKSLAFMYCPTIFISYGHHYKESRLVPCQCTCFSYRQSYIESHLAPCPQSTYLFLL